MYFILATNVESLHSVDSVRIDQLQHRLDILQNLIDTSNGTISNEIALSNNYLTLVSIGLAIISILLTIIGAIIAKYINSLYKKVRIIEKTIVEKEKVIKELSCKVQTTNDKITNDIESIYSRLRQEELKAKVKRLVIEPLDIKHCISSLLSNDLDESLFEDLYQAYKKLISSGKAEKGASFLESSYKDNYLLVFFQHFIIQSILNSDLRKEIISFFKTGCKCAYERDIIKCTTDLCKALNESIISSPVDILYEYLIAVNESEFKSLSEIKEILNSELEEKSILRQAIDRCTSNNVYLELFDNKQPIDDEQ